VPAGPLPGPTREAVFLREVCVPFCPGLQELDMALKWTDSIDIAIELDELYPHVDPMRVNFVDLRKWVLELDDFDDEPEHCGERILEAIQLAWMEERH
jgi:FeS assembly protein IscX